MKYMQLNSGVYAIYDLSKNCIYVGASRDLQKRYQQHIEMLNRGDHHNKNVQEYCNHVGIQNFVFVPIFFCDDESLFFHERKFIDYLKPFAYFKSAEIKLKKINGMQYNVECDKIVSTWNNEWVSFQDISKLLGYNAKKTGQICVALGFESKKERHKANRKYYFITKG